MATAQRFAFNVEQKGLEARDRPRRFLEALAAILEHGSYGVALGTYSRMRGRYVAIS